MSFIGFLDSAIGQPLYTPCARCPAHPPRILGEAGSALGTQSRLMISLWGVAVVHLVDLPAGAEEPERAGT